MLSSVLHQFSNKEAAMELLSIIMDLRHCLWLLLSKIKAYIATVGAHACLSLDSMRIR